MKIYFRHYSGAITEYDYLFFDCMAEVSELEEDEALNGGWLPDDYIVRKNSKGVIEKSHWYQARQTRIKLSEFKDNAKTRKCRKKCSEIKTKCFSVKDVDMSIVEDIFYKYINFKNFKSWDISKLIESESDKKYFLFYYLNNKPIAFTFLRDVGSESVFSTQFAWDYKDSKLYLGKYANLAEIDYCIKNNKKYMYIGAGYENACIYKSDYNGFEFWNGQVWSSDKDLYKKLCERDSNIVKTKELDKIKEDDDINIFGDEL